jgi:sugar phosphate permease
MDQQANKSPSSSLNEKEAVVPTTQAADYDGGARMAHVLTEGRDNFVSPDDVKRTKRIMRAIDIRILPVASLLYLFSFLDRSAIGNARVAGMNTALKLTYNQYAASVSIFFALYCLLEVPSNLALKKYGAKVWLPFIVIVWGLFMLFTGLVKNFAGLFSLR